MTNTPLLNIAISNKKATALSGELITVGVPSCPDWMDGRTRDDGTVAVNVLGSDSLLLLDNGTPVPNWQLDMPITDASGSKRFRVLSAYIASMTGNETRQLQVQRVRPGGAMPVGTPITVADVIANTRWDRRLTFTNLRPAPYGTYVGSVRQALLAGAWNVDTRLCNHGTFLNGCCATQWLVSAPIVYNNSLHPLLWLQAFITAFKANTGAVSPSNPIIDILCDLQIKNGWINTGPNGYGTEYNHVMFYDLLDEQADINTGSWSTLRDLTEQPNYGTITLQHSNKDQDFRDVEGGGGGYSAQTFTRGTGTFAFDGTLNDDRFRGTAIVANPAGMPASGWGNGMGIGRVMEVTGSTTGRISLLGPFPTTTLTLQTDHATAGYRTNSYTRHRVRQPPLTGFLMRSFGVKGKSIFARAVSLAEPDVLRGTRRAFSEAELIFNYIWKGVGTTDNDFVFPETDIGNIGPGDQRRIDFYKQRPLHPYIAMNDGGHMEEIVEGHPGDSHKIGILPSDHLMAITYFNARWRDHIQMQADQRCAAQIGFIDIYTGLPYRYDNPTLWSRWWDAPISGNHPINITGFNVYGSGADTGADCAEGVDFNSQTNHSGSLFLPWMVFGDPVYLQQIVLRSLMSYVKSNGAKGATYTGLAKSQAQPNADLDHYRSGDMNSQTRGYAWSMRDQIQCAFAIPDNTTLFGVTQTLERQRLNEMSLAWKTRLIDPSTEVGDTRLTKMWTYNGPHMYTLNQDTIANWQHSYMCMGLMHGIELDVLDANGKEFARWLTSNLRILAGDDANCNGWWGVQAYYPGIRNLTNTDTFHTNVELYRIWSNLNPNVNAGSNDYWRDVGGRGPPETYNPASVSYSYGGVGVSVACTFTPSSVYGNAFPNPANYSKYIGTRYKTGGTMWTIQSVTGPNNCMASPDSSPPSSPYAYPNFAFPPGGDGPHWPAAWDNNGNNTAYYRGSYDYQQSWRQVVQACSDQGWPYALTGARNFDSFFNWSKFNDFARYPQYGLRASVGRRWLNGPPDRGVIPPPVWKAFWANSGRRRQPILGA